MAQVVNTGPVPSFDREFFVLSSFTASVRAVWLFLALLLGSPCVVSQSEPDASTSAIGTLTAAVREAPVLSEEQRAQLLLDLQDAARKVQQADDFDTRASEFEAAVKDEQSEVDRYQRLVDETDSTAPTVTSLLGRDPSLEEIEAELDIIAAERKSLAEQRSAELSELNRDAGTDEALQQRLATVSAELDALPPGPQPGSDDLSQQVALAKYAAQRRLLLSEQAMLKQQLRGASAVGAIRSAREGWLDASIEETDDLLQALRDAAAATRQSAVQRRMEQTRKLVEPLGPGQPDIAAFAQGNLALIEVQQRVADELDSAREKNADLRGSLDYIAQDYSMTQRRVEVAGLEGELGRVMMAQLASLPDEDRIKTRVEQRNGQLAHVSVQSIDTDEALRQSSERSEFLRAAISNYADLPRPERKIVNQLYEARRELLRENLEAQNSLIRVLVDSNQAARDVMTAIGEYRNFLTGHLLWIRDYHFVDSTELVSQVRLILDPAPLLAPIRHWPQLLRDPGFVLLGLLFGLLVVTQGRVRTIQQALLGVPVRPSDESPTKIFRGIALGVVRSAVFPLGLLLLAAAIAIAGQDRQAFSLANSVLVAALLVLVLQLIISATGRMGTGRRLLKWNGQRADALRRDLPWLAIVVPVACGVATFSMSYWPQDSGGALAALATFLVSLSLFAAGIRLLRSCFVEGDALGRLLLRIGVLLAGATVFMHLSGQLFAAHLYLEALVLTVLAVSFTFFISSVLQRIILIYRGRLERRRRNELREQADRDEQGEAAEDGEADWDIDAVGVLSDAQTQLLGAVRLVAMVGLLWLIWSPALPAITLLEDVTLWSVVDPQLPVGELRTISLATLMLVGVIIALTVLLVRHLPSLVQVLLLEYAPVSAGARYATGVLLQYLILGLGAAVSLSLLGFAWSKVQWLVAALGVGIGFGLQEIVANFISGIILLFERPIRVGDIISVSGYDGKVVNISARATVIETFEGKELLIPNKDLITGVVNNWSLSSSKLRIVIPVGVAYGSDVRLAMRILVEAARNHEAILDQPEPVATFEDFGDNALTLWLRCYAESDFIHRWTELRVEIYDRMAEAGIGIAFPQRDVHLDAQEPIPVQLVERPVGEKQ